jgi:hypothetical protein
VCVCVCVCVLTLFIYYYYHQDYNKKVLVTHTRALTIFNGVVILDVPDIPSIYPASHRRKPSQYQP